MDDALAQLAVNPKKGAMYARAAVANARNNAIMQGGNPGGFRVMVTAGLAFWSVAMLQSLS